jgi:hypothetical protein
VRLGRENNKHGQNSNRQVRVREHTGGELVSCDTLKSSRSNRQASVEYCLARYICDPTSKKQIDLDIAGLIRDSEFVRNSKTEPIAITEVFESSATKLETRFCLCFFPANTVDCYQQESCCFCTRIILLCSIRHDALCRQPICFAFE